MLDINVNSIANDQLAPIVEDIRARNPINSEPKKYLADKLLEDRMYGGTGFDQPQQKPSLEVKVPISEGYDFVAGSYLSKFHTY